MADYGIDYGMGTTNIDPETGIRYGVIHQNAVLQAWVDSAEADYGAPHCPKCGNPAGDIDKAPDEYKDDPAWENDGCDFACADCHYTFDSEWAYGDEPVAWYVDEDGLQASCGGDDCDIFVIRSPYYTHAKYCSPCAPGACYLKSPTIDESGPRAYCFPPDWFEWFPGCGETLQGEYNGRPTSCTYPVYRVADGKCIYRPKRSGNAEE